MSRKTPVCQTLKLAKISRTAKQRVDRLQKAQRDHGGGVDAAAAKFGPHQRKAAKMRPSQKTSAESKSPAQVEQASSGIPRQVSSRNHPVPNTLRKCFRRRGFSWACRKVIRVAVT